MTPLVEHPLPESRPIPETPILIDRDCLRLASVAARLRCTLRAATPACREPLHLATPGDGSLAEFRAVVAECADALDQLRTGFGLAQAHTRQVRQDLQHARAALALSHIALQGLRAGEREALHQARHDGLTTLPNRSAFRERLGAVLARGHGQRPPLAVLYIDLDGFKAINDRHGHAAGDEVLCIVASRLTHALRAGDMVGRLGGDEFACLLADLQDDALLAHLVRKLHDAVAMPITLDAVRLIVRPSIGIARCPGDGHTTDALLQHADSAMYQAKRLRSGHAFHVSPHHQEIDMSKGQRGNKEAKKPKQLRPATTPPVPVGGLTPIVPAPLPGKRR